MVKLKIYVLIVFLLLLYKEKIQAQSKIITEQQVIDLALEKSVIMNEAKASISKQKINAQSTFSLEPFYLEYRKVKINPTTFVQEISAAQNFGAIPVHFKRRRLAKSELELTEINAKITEKQLVRTVRLLYQQWHYLYALKSLLEKQQENVNKVKNFAENLYQSGEIGGLENDITTLQALSIQTQKNTISKEFIHVENQLKSLLQLQQKIEPVHEFPKPLPFEFSENTFKGFTEAINKSNQVAGEKVALAKSAYFPEISLGLINRKAGEQKDFMGFVVGVGIPLPFGDNKAEVKKQKIMREQKAFENKAKQIEIENTKSSLTEQLQLLNSEINSINHTFEKAEKFIEKLSIAYEAGEIGAYKYNQSFDAYFEVMQNYLSLINTYNQMVIEYEFYIDTSLN